MTMEESKLRRGQDLLFTTRSSSLVGEYDVFWTGSGSPLLVGYPCAIQAGKPPSRMEERLCPKARNM